MMQDSLQTEQLKIVLDTHFKQLQAQLQSMKEELSRVKEDVSKLAKGQREAPQAQQQWQPPQQQWQQPAQNQFAGQFGAANAPVRESAPSAQPIDRNGVAPADVSIEKFFYVGGR